MTSARLTGPVVISAMMAGLAPAAFAQDSEALAGLVGDEAFAVGMVWEEMDAVLQRNGFARNSPGRQYYHGPDEAITVRLTPARKGAPVTSIAAYGAVDEAVMAAIITGTMGEPLQCSSSYMGEPEGWPDVDKFRPCKWTSAPAAPRLGRVELHGDPEDFYIQFVE